MGKALTLKTRFLYFYGTFNGFYKWGEGYIDPEEQRYSAYAEIECEGEKRKYLLITIKTPTGKVKYETKIY